MLTGAYATIKVATDVVQDQDNERGHEGTAGEAGVAGSLSGSTNEHPVHEGDRIRIGRSASNDIQISEGHVSREHAIVACLDGAFSVDDVGSANGTFVNGLQVYGMNPLAIGDELHLFVSVLKLLAASDEAGPEAVERVSAVAGDRASLRITRGPQRGQMFALLKEEQYIGRSTPSSNWEIALQDPTVSRPHAFLVKEDQQWKLFDLGSINGTSVNSQPIAGGKAHGCAMAIALCSAAP